MKYVKVYVNGDLRAVLHLEPRGDYRINPDLLRVAKGDSVKLILLGPVPHPRGIARRPKETLHVGS